MNNNLESTEVEELAVAQVKQKVDRHAQSFQELRKSIGMLGIALPIVLVVGNNLISKPLRIEESISSYYYTDMRDVFVGVLCAIGVFLFTYKGPERQDDIIGNLACIFALGVAFVPTVVCAPVHYLSAGAFLLTLAYFALVLFRKSAPLGVRTPEKLIRNKVYTVCGWTIIGAVAACGLVLALLPENHPLEQYDPVFWLEAIAVWAFGWSWLVKGEGILKDNEI